MSHFHTLDAHFHLLELGLHLLYVPFAVFELGKIVITTLVLLHARKKPIKIITYYNF